MSHSSCYDTWNDPVELNVTDLKQHLYCPRIPYFLYVLSVPRPVTYKMQHGIKEHMELDRLEKRRGYRSYGLSEGKRLFHVLLKSETLHLFGKLDLVITYEKDGVQQYLPVEFKNNEGRVHTNFKYQLVAYAMLLEEHFGVPVKEGIVYQIPTKSVRFVTITEEMRKYVRDSLAFIRRVIQAEAFPEPVSRARCTDCEFRRYCNDFR